MTERGNKEDKIVVFKLINNSKCGECGEELGAGRLLRLEKERPLCLGCADFADLLFLPSGDAALTRRASKYSDITAVVLKFSRARKRYERQGVLVTETALERAEVECLADEEARARARERAAERREEIDVAYRSSFAEEIRNAYPRCPPDEAVAIAEHACLKYSGRVGRTSAAKQLSKEAIDLAVRARVRHARTPYEKLLGRGWERAEARRKVAEEIEQILETWRGE